MELEQRLSLAPLTIPLDVPLHPTLDLLPAPSDALDFLPNPANTQNQNFEENLANLELPSMEIGGAEHADGFNSLFEQTAAAAEAEAAEEIEGEAQSQGVDVDGAGDVEMRHEAEGVEVTGEDGQRQEGDGTGIEGSGEQAELPQAEDDEPPTQVQGQSNSRNEPYLMTLANAAEAQAPRQGLLPPIMGKRRPGRPFNNPPPETVWSTIWRDLKEDMQVVPQVDDRAGGVIVSDW